MLVTKKWKTNQKKRNHSDLSQDIKKEWNKDPLVVLYQMDSVKDIHLNNELINLIRRMLNNVEEFYQLRDMIKEIMKNDEDKNINEFFNNLLSEVHECMYV